MNFSNFQIVFQEVPDEVSLCFSISGCNLGCKGCHSTETWNPKYGDLLTKEKLLDIIEKYKSLSTCVLFYGGEWEIDNLIELLTIAKDNNFKTCLYTGLEYRELVEKNKNILSYLDFLKTGRWIQARGGLDAPFTNQKFYKIENNILNDLTYKFKK